MYPQKNGKTTDYINASTIFSNGTVAHNRDTYVGGKLIVAGRNILEELDELKRRR